MPGTCLAGCIQRYTCGEIQKPIEADSLAPFVRIFFESPDQPIVTVGNESSPSFDNHAVIKSFQLGHSDGIGVTVEILDEQGGNFHAFADRMSKCLNKASNHFTMRVQFGWIGTQCGSKTGGIVKESVVITLILLGIEINFVDGKVKFIITGKDLMQHVFSARHDEAQGDDSNPRPIKQAIRDLCSKNEPKMQVEFRRMLPSGTFVEYGFKESFDGPKSVYTSDGQNKLATIMRWLEPFTTDKDKGILPVWDSLSKVPKLILLEDPRPECGQITDCDMSVIGTWIVNGGRCLCYNSTILTEDGWKRIDWIVKNKYSGFVKSVNEQGKLEWNKIINWYKSPLGERNYYKVCLHNSKKGRQKNGAIFTNDHELLTLNGYKRVDELTIKDKIHSGTEMPNKKAHEAIVGMILGYAHIKNKSNSFEVIHSKKQEQYTSHIASLIRGKFSLKGKRKCKATSKASPYWRKMRSISYSDKNKKTTNELLKDFSIISLAYLFMDNGHLSKKQLAEIKTCSFSEEECVLIVKKIKELGIDCCLKNSGKYPIIRFRKEETRMLSALISPYVIKELDYKLLPEHRDIEKISIIDEWEPFYDSFDLLKAPTELERRRKTVYCIEVSKNNNFITHSGVSHNCSPVISFSPKMNWNWTVLSGATGNAGGAASADPVKKEKKCQGEGKQAGISQGILQTRAGMDHFGPGRVIRETEKSQNANRRANQVTEGITAELRIQGNCRPEFCSPLLCKGRYASIVVINPFHLFDGINKCGEWLALPGCNEVLSNRKWRIDGVEHNIKEGSYTTTLKLTLEVPGIDIDSNSPLGADSMGYNPPGTC